MPETSCALTCHYLGFNQEAVPISRAEFDAVKPATAVLTTALAIEEKLDIVLENHAALERHLLDLVLEHALFTGRVEELVHGARRSTNRHLTNYLATGRQYRDQVRHDIAHAVPGAQARTVLGTAIDTQRDENLGYRAMEELRNHAQHRALPIWTVRFSATPVSPVPGARFSVVPLLSVRELYADARFEKSVRNELAQQADTKGDVALMPLVRQHRDGLTAIHATVRTLLAEPIRTAETLFTSLTEREEAAFGPNPVALVAVEFQADGTYDDWQYVTDAYTERRRDLELKNRDLAAVAARAVSSA